MFDKKKIKSALESMMFIWGDPLDIKAAAQALNVENKEIKECFKELQQEYKEAGRGIEIREINKSFQFVTKKENFLYVQNLCSPKKTKNLSQPALEVLAIIAYKQPITKRDIDGIRGIKSDHIIEGLMRKGLVIESGRAPSIGKPILYGTSNDFLRYFDLTNLSELPELEEDDEYLSGNMEENGDNQQITMDIT